MSLKCMSPPRYTVSFGFVYSEYPQLSNSTDQNPSWKVSKEIPHILCNPEVNNPVHNSPPHCPHPQPD